MHIAVCGPVDLELLRQPLGPSAPDLSTAYSHPLPAKLALQYLMKGHSVSVVALDPTRSSSMSLQMGNLEVIVLPMRPRARHRAEDCFAHERRSIASALRAGGPDVVHAHWTYEFALGSLASGIPTLVTCHDWAPAVLRHHRHPYRVVRLLMQIATLRKARSMTAVSPYIKARTDVIRRVTGRSPVELIPNGVARQPTLEPATLDPMGGNLLAVNVGFDRLKNVYSAIRSLSIIRSARPTATLTLIGQGYESDGPAATWAHEHGLSAGLIFKGPMSHEAVLDAMRTSHVLLHSSLEESFGMVVLEAMSVGRPVVCGNRSGAAAWVMGPGGVSTDVTRVEAIASATLHVLQNLSSFSLAATRRAAAFDLSNIADRYIQELETSMRQTEPIA